MVGPTLVLFALNALVWWIVVLAHELGHAAVVLTRTEGLVVVRAGSRSPKWRHRIGRLQLELGPVPLPFQPSDAVAEVYSRVRPSTRITLALAGPLAGGAAAALFFLLGWRLQSLPLQVTGWIALVLDLSNLIPFRFRGVRSDGAYLVEALRGRSSIGDESGDLFEAVVSRWLVLATDFHAAFAPHDRDIGARFNSKMRDAKAAGNHHTIAIHRLTFAGWCWRKAEQGDTTAIRETVLDARHQATRAGLSRPNIIAAAAGQLVRARIDFEAGSPTPDSLEKGFLRVRENARYRELSDGTARTAFCFGVAMYDVAAIAG